MRRLRALLIAMAMVSAGAVFFVVRRGAPLRRFVVEGESMMPAYADGDHVVVYAWAYRGRAPRSGEVVVLRDPDEERWLVKRVAAMTVDGRVIVVGDNAAASRDSRAFGPVDAGAIVGRVIYQY